MVFQPARHCRICDVAFRFLHFAFAAYFAPHNNYVDGINRAAPSNQRWPLRVNQSMEMCHEILCSLPQEPFLFQHRDRSRASAACQHDAGPDRRHGRRPLRDACLGKNRQAGSSRQSDRPVFLREAGLRLCRSGKPKPLPEASALAGSILCGRDIPPGLLHHKTNILFASCSIH